LLRHRGCASVFEDYADLHRRIDDESFPLQQVGPPGSAGHARVRRGAIPRGVDGKEKLQPSDKRIAAFFPEYSRSDFFYINYFTYL
jgi:hypothetical protein